MILVGDLSVLGVTLPYLRIQEVLSQFRRWNRVGFAIVLVSGALLWWAEPVVRYKSVSLRTKLALLGLAGVNALLFRRQIYRSLAACELGPVKSRGARMAACLSLLLWVALFFAGRGIAFF